jgi:hypothetical protein
MLSLVVVLKVFLSKIIPGQNGHHTRPLSPFLVYAQCISAGISETGGQFRQVGPYRLGNGAAVGDDG